MGTGLLPLDTAIQWIANGHTFWTLVGLYRAEVYYVPPTAFVRHHLNVHGKYSFLLPELLDGLRPLGDPGADPEDDDVAHRDQEPVRGVPRRG